MSQVMRKLFANVLHHDNVIGRIREGDFDHCIDGLMTSEAEGLNRQEVLTELASRRSKEEGEVLDANLGFLVALSANRARRKKQLQALRDRHIVGPIHTTIGVYPKPDRYLWKINGVAEEFLEEHIAFNKKWRFGRALFVDGKCVYRGHVAPEDIDRIEAELEAEPIVRTRDTAPYT